MVCPVCFGPHEAKDCPRTCRHCGEHHHMSQCPTRCLTCQGTGHTYIHVHGAHHITHGTLHHDRDESLAETTCPDCHGSGRHAPPARRP